MATETIDRTRRCGRCLHAKLRAGESVTCWNTENPWYGATLSAFDWCERFEQKVIRVETKEAVKQ